VRLGCATANIYWTRVGPIGGPGTDPHPQLCFGSSFPLWVEILEFFRGQMMDKIHEEQSVDSMKRLLTSK
jgi:hypothetical protein